MQRSNHRKFDALRQVKITRDFIKNAASSVLIEMGDTKVICTASLDESVPPHRKGSGKGWVTAEYAMLPASTSQRNQRETRLKGRTAEIQRLIGRSLRAIVDMQKLGERSILIDADVIQADGGTRTAAITGSFIALYGAAQKLIARGKISQNPITDFLAAVSVGMIDGQEILDLDYAEDFKAGVDMNLVMTASGNLVEIQGTAEGAHFSQDQLNRLVELGRKGINELIAKQKEVLGV